MRRRASRWLPAAQAFLAVLAVCAVVYLCFDYGYVVSDRGEQRNSISRIVVPGKSELARELDLRDPARVFGIPSGGFSALRPEYAARHEKPVGPTPEMVAPPAAGAPGKAAEHPFPVTFRFPPAEGKTADVRMYSPAVIAADGRLLRFAELKDAADGKKIDGSTWLKIDGFGSVRRYRVVRSSGNAAADERAGQTLLDADAGNGLYTVVWNGGEAGER